MKNLSSKFKTLSCIGLLLFMPVISMAAEAASISTTTAKSILEIVQKDEKREEIRKQLNDMIELCAALVSKIQNLEDRVMDRVTVIESLDNLSVDAKTNLDLKKKKLDELLAVANDRVDVNLVKLAESVLNATKPAKAVTAFKKEVNLVKTNITSAHKIVIEMIDLIKKETVKFDMKNEKDGSDTEATSTATSTDQTSN